MKNSNIIFGGIILIILLGGGYWLVTRQGPTPQTQDTQLANPASVNCTQKPGARLEIVDEALGQVGYCHLVDGRVCEEWALYRDNVCTPPPGSTTTPLLPAR